MFFYAHVLLVLFTLVRHTLSKVTVQVRIDYLEIYGISADAKPKCERSAFQPSDFGTKIHFSRRSRLLTTSTLHTLKLLN